LELALHEAATMAVRQIFMSKLDRFIFPSLDWLVRWQSVPQNGIVDASMWFGRMQRSLRPVPCRKLLPGVEVPTTGSRRAILAASKAPKFFGHHGAEGQHGAPAGGPAVDPGDITTAS
jgi:hypothetical protein